MPLRNCNVDRARVQIASREPVAPTRHLDLWLDPALAVHPRIIIIRRGRKLCHSLKLGVVVFYQPVHHLSYSINPSSYSWLLLALQHECLRLPLSLGSSRARLSSFRPPVNLARTMKFLFHIYSRLLRVTSPSLPYLCPTSQSAGSLHCG